MKSLLCTFLLCSSFLLAQENNSSVSTRDTLIEKGRQAYFSKKLPLLKKITTQIDSLYQKTSDSILLAKYFHFKALQSKLTYTNDSAFYYYHLSKDISKKTNDSLAVGRRLLSLAILQKDAKDFLGSEISSIEALRYLEPIKPSIYLERIYNNLGVVAEELDQKNAAIEHYNKTLKINNITKDQRSYLFTINNLGLLYQKRNNHNKAISYFLITLNSNPLICLYFGLLVPNILFT